MGHRAVVVLRGRNLSCRVSETDPEELGVAPLKSRPLDKDPGSARTADVLNKFTDRAMEILEGSAVNRRRVSEGKLPANVVLARGAGMEPDIQPFEERYGVKAACVSATSLIIGVCKSLGMDIIEVPEANGHVDSKIGKKAEAAVKALGKYDFVFCISRGQMRLLMMASVRCKGCDD